MLSLFGNMTLTNLPRSKYQLMKSGLIIFVLIVISGFSFLNGQTLEEEFEEFLKTTEDEFNENLQTNKEEFNEFVKLKNEEFSEFIYKADIEFSKFIKTAWVNIDHLKIDSLQNESKPDQETSYTENNAKVDYGNIPSTINIPRLDMEFLKVNQAILIPPQRRTLNI